MVAKHSFPWGGLLLAFACITTALAADDFDKILKPLFAKNCIKCHGEKKVKGKINLKEITNAKQFLSKPKLIKELIGVIDMADMPPEDEPQLTKAQRTKLLTTLKAQLRVATAGVESKPSPIRRLNRFQYNNSVRDLFQLNRDVFGLSEKLMTRQGNYLNAASKKMPDRVNVTSHALKPKPGMQGVRAFPKDLRASHGFDNQANQLTLSPLHLDAFLRLSVSILDSPDFNKDSVGIWSEFFKAPPKDADIETEVRKRLGPFLDQAFRNSIDDATLNRYTSFALSKVNQGLSFPASMKKSAAAALSSPMFLYRYSATKAKNNPFALASNLSFFLWASSPDAELLRLAESGELAKPEVLNKTIDRMLASPKIERFLDTFPAQWMQLENVLAATPDPCKHRYFSLDKNNPASLQMLMEPLLLFDAVFIEDRPIVELITPAFGYQSSFLEDWYKTRLEPEPVDEVRIAKENKQRNEVIRDLQASLTRVREELAGLDRAMVDPIKEKRAAVDLAAGQAAWEETQAKLVDEAVTLSTWKRIGPFAGGTLDNAHAKAFIDETAVDLAKTYGDQKWVEVKEYVDGKVHTLNHANCATYIYRTIQARSARSLELSLGSDDSFKLWLNGQLVAEKKITRGVAPDQDKVRVELLEGENTLLMKISNGGGGYGFYFKTQSVPLPGPVVAVLQVTASERTEDQKQVLVKYYLSIAPELAKVRREISQGRVAVVKQVQQLEDQLKKAPKPRDVKQHRADAQRRFDDQLRGKMRSRAFKRMPATDERYGGIITSAAMLSMTAGPKRTHPIARGAWIIEVILNDPPPPPPNDIPPLNEDSGPKNQTIREKFAEHRKNPDCAGCHSKLDPLGFALENFDITGRWRDKYENGRDVDASGTLLRKYEFNDIVRFKESIVKEDRRFAKAFTAHLLRFALARELDPADTLTIDHIVTQAESSDYNLQTLIREVIRSQSFQNN